MGQPAEIEFREVDLGSDRTLTITEGETASVSMMNDNEVNNLSKFPLILYHHIIGTGKILYLKRTPL